MRQIYGNSERVIVFLGEDIVSSTAKFPTYRDIDEINVSPSDGDLVPSQSPTSPSTDTHSIPTRYDNLSRLLTRKYFSRVWMIQELIASNRAVIRVGNVDFRADAATIYRPSRQGTGLSRTRAPWFQYLGRKMINPARAGDIASLAALTSQCRASDP
jgi:hypothetical protein